MIQTAAIKRSDINILLRIVGCRAGATWNSILAFERSHHRPSLGEIEIRESLDRLLDAGLIVQANDNYLASADLQSAFLAECRNCRDTIEEFDILCRITQPIS